MAKVEVKLLAGSGIVSDQQADGHLVELRDPAKLDGCQATTGFHLADRIRSLEAQCVGGVWRQRMVIDAETDYVTGGVRQTVNRLANVFARAPVPA